MALRVRHILIPIADDIHLEKQRLPREMTWNRILEHGVRSLSVKNERKQREVKSEVVRKAA